MISKSYYNDDINNNEDIFIPSYLHLSLPKRELNVFDVMTLNNGLMEYVNYKGLSLYIYLILIFD